MAGEEVTLMATTYDFISANKRRSVILVLFFIVVVGLVAWAFSKLLAAGPGGVIIATVAAVVMSLGGYYGGDRLALAVAGAKGPLRKDDQPYLFNLVENLCIANGQPMPALYLIPDRAINAFATGRDPGHASLAVTTGAIERLENEELEGVLAHELSHAKNYDIRFMTLVAILVGVIALLSDFFWRWSWLGGGRRRSDSREGGQAAAILMIVGLVLLILAPIIGQLIKLAVSRRREFLADASAALLTRYPEGLARALEKIAAGRDEHLTRVSTATAHLYFSNPFGARWRGLGTLFSTHPPIDERIKALRAMSGAA